MGYQRPIKQFRKEKKMNDVQFVDQIYYETLTRDIYYFKLRDAKGYKIKEKRK